MASSSEVRLEEFGNGKSPATSRDPIVRYEPRNDHGCYVTRSKGALVVILFLCICVALVVATYHLHPDYNKDDDQETTAATLSATTSMTSPLPTQPPAASELRLPVELVPRHYNLQLRLDIFRENPEDFLSTGA